MQQRLLLGLGLERDIAGAYRHTWRRPWKPAPATSPSPNPNHLLLLRPIRLPLLLPLLLLRLLACQPPICGAGLQQAAAGQAVAEVCNHVFVGVWEVLAQLR